MSCFICHSEEKLKERILEWTMFDGTRQAIKIEECKPCMKETELLKYEPPKEWIDGALKKVLTPNAAKIRG